MKKRVLIATEYYYPIVTSTGYYMTEIAEFLARKNLDVHVICTGSKYNEVSDYKLAAQEVHNGVNIHRVLTKELDKNRFLIRSYRLFISSIKMAFKLYSNSKKGDVLLVVTNPAFLLLFVPVVKRIKKLKSYLLVHDIFPENLVAIKKVKENSLLFLFLRKLYNRAYSKFDLCISIGRDMSDVIEKKNNKRNSIEMIPNWADIDVVFPVSKKDTDLYKKINLVN